VTAEPDMTIAAANASPASRPPDSRFMIAPLRPSYCGHDVVFGCAL